MWKPSKFNIFEHSYTIVDKPITTAPQTRIGEKLAKFAFNYPQLALVLREGLPYAMVTGSVIMIVRLCWALDKHIVEQRERDRLEEIELYGEEMITDATPKDEEDYEREEEERRRKKKRNKKK